MVDGNRMKRMSQSLFKRGSFSTMMATGLHTPVQSNNSRNLKLKFERQLADLIVFDCLFSEMTTGSSETFFFRFGLAGKKRNYCANYREHLNSEFMENSQTKLTKLCTFRFNFFSSNYRCYTCHK